MKKRCYYCRQTKSSNDFHKNRHMPDGLQTRCKECRLEEKLIIGEMTKRWMEENRKAGEGNGDAAIRHYCETEGVEGLMKLLNKKTDTDEQTDCLLWTGGKQNTYPAWNVKLQSDPSLFYRVRMHRLAYAVFAGYDALPKFGEDGIVPDALALDHRCGRTLCLNVLHLQVVSFSENSSYPKTGRTAVRFDDLRKVA